MRKLKQQIFTSALSLLLCVSMLLGTTFAWFTDSETSAGNVITSGSLDAEMFYSDTLLDVDSDQWVNADGKAVFNYDQWEPGYTDIKYIKVVNEGNLAFKWRMTIEAVGATTDLGEVIEVFYVNPAESSIDSLYGMTAEGWLSDVISDCTALEGTLLPEGKTAAGMATGETVIAIVLHMDENAGNQYQGMSFGDGFALNLVATQYTYEQDSFNNNYDANATWPNNIIINQSTASALIQKDAENKSTVAVTMTTRDGKIKATVPAGALVEDDKNALTLRVGDLPKSEANIVVDNNEAALSIDVHVDGVAEGNEAVIEVLLKALLPVGLNMGNFRLYHVEDGVTVAMNYMANGSTEEPTHNSFKYDPATGDTTLYMKSFSEIALVADTENAWNGTVAEGFAGGEGTEAAPYLIANADQLALLGELISNDNSNYAEKHYKLIANVNLGATENANKGILFYPIGYTAKGGDIAAQMDDDAPEFIYHNDNYDDSEYSLNRSAASAAAAEGEAGVWYTYGGSFRGTFDGNGNTIANIYQNTWQMKGDYEGDKHYWNDAMGIFGYVNGGTVKNLTVDNFTSDGEFTPTGVIAAYAANATFENIALKNCNPRVYNTGNGGIVGVGGNSDDASDKKLTFTNITVDNSNKISALWGSWDVACGGLMGMFRGRGLVHFDNCHVGAQIDVYNDVCGNYQYYWYRYAGMIIGSLRGRNITDPNGYIVPDMSGITANNCTVHFGTWNDYYYCELVANSLASYTHDHQFSRLTEIESLEEIKNGDEWTKTGNFLYNNECFHIVSKDGTLTRHLHEDSGYETVNGETVLKENNQIIYLPFNQLFQGDGWGVKHVPVYNGETYAFEGITILDRDIANSEYKFEASINGASFETGTTLTVGEIFAAIDGARINAHTLKVFVSPVGEDSTVSAIFTPNESDWTKGTLTFSGIGAAKIVITDYNYCKETVTSVTISDHPMVDKFVANGNLSFTHTVQGGTISKTLGEIFSAVDGAIIDSASVEVSAIAFCAVEDEELLCTYVKNDQDWTKSILTFTGVGVLTITITDGAYCNFGVAAVSIGHPENADKFVAKSPISYTAKHDKETFTFKIGDLFALNGTPDIVTDVVISVGGTEYSTEYKRTADDWTALEITLSLNETVTVTITDNNYCNIASNTVSFKAPVEEEKFEYKGESSYCGGTTVTLGDLFALKAERVLGNGVVVNIDGTEVNVSADSWQSHEIIFDKIGSITITIKEASDYCFETTKTITVNNYDKFTASDSVGVQDAYTQIALGDLFSVKEGAVIRDDVTVTVVPPQGAESEARTLTSTTWASATIDLDKLGEWTVIIKDAYYCNEAEVTFTVKSTDKFAKKFANENYLYRVGNQNTVSLGSLFSEIDTAVTLSSANVEFATVSGNASGTYTANATWANGTIQFSGTGVVEVTISAPAANPLTLTLEVVDAVNATTATSATENNVVLLNDAGFSSLEVSGGYTLYGNGFTLTCGSDSAALDMGYSFVTLNNGTLDNVQIVCPNYDYAVLYKSNMTESDNRTEITDKTRYYNVKSGVMASGNSQILNSRISGARAAVNVSGGNCLIDNSRIELGAVASLLVGAANSVTLRDVTLVQKPTESTYKAEGAENGTTLMGFSVLMMCNSDGDAAPLTLEGTLVQNAWVDEEDKQYVPSAGQSIINTVLANTDYTHDLDGDGTNESLNLGFAYMPESLTSKVNTTTITDNRTNKDTVPYNYAEVSILNGKTYVYSYKNTNGTAESFKNLAEYTPNKQGDVISVTYTDTSDGLTHGKTFGTDGWVYELNVDLDKLSGYEIDFSKLSMSVNGVIVNDYKVNGNTKPASAAVTAGGTTYTLTATIDGKEYSATYKVTGTETSKESPSLVASNYEAGLCVASSYGGTWHGAAPALQGIQIKYWSVAEKQYKTINLADYTPTTAGKQNGTNTTWTYSPANGDFTLTLTGGQVHSSNNVYAMPVVCDGKLYFVASSTNGLVNSGNSARTIPVSYSFEDNNNGEVLTFSHTWSVAENKDAQYKYSDFCNGTMTKLEAGSSSGGTCLAEGTLITLADGTKKAVEDLRKGDLVMSFDHLTGEIVYKDVIIVVRTQSDVYHKNIFVFDDGTELATINEHGIFDLDLNKYVNIDHENYTEYLGHTFVSVNSKGDIASKKLVNVISTVESGYKYDIVTNGTLNYVAEDTLSVTHVLVDVINTFDFGDDLKYDQEKMQADIAKYGLYDYSEWEEYCDVSVFEQYNIPVMKVGIEKGLYTKEYIISLINTYVLDDSVQIV